MEPTTIKKKRLKALKRASRATEIILQNLCDSDFIQTSGENAYRDLENYKFDIALDIFRTLKGEPTENEEQFLRDYMT